MKFLFPLAVVVIVAVIFFYFSGNFRQSVDSLGSNRSSPPADLYNNQTLSPTKNPSGARGTSTPPGFRGPTGPPHIIGPSGPPPNY